MPLVDAGPKTPGAPLRRVLHSLCPCLAIAAAAGAADTPVPPGYTTTRTSNVDDFEYFAGAWTTHQRRLEERGTGSDEWETFPATLCMSEYLDGKATVDELYFPTKGWAGQTVRTFNVKKHQWSIYWVSSATGVMGTPVVGGFHGKHGEFYGEHSDNGRPVKVRFIWDKLDRDHARWEQALRVELETEANNATAQALYAVPK